jgi:hypothetical protein
MRSQEILVTLKTLLDLDCELQQPPSRTNNGDGTFALCVDCGIERAEELLQVFPEAVIVNSNLLIPLSDEENEELRQAEAAWYKAGGGPPGAFR